MNVLVSAMLWPGTPTRLIDLAKAVAATGFSPAELITRYQRLAHLVTVHKLQGKFVAMPMLLVGTCIVITVAFICR